MGMGQVLANIWTDINALGQSLGEWLQNSWTAGNGQAIIAGLIVLVLLLLLATLASARRGSGASGRPELLISRGRVQGVENSTLTELVMHVSNLGDRVVQLLEVAISGPLDPDPQVAEVSVLVPAHKSVDISLHVEEPQGDTGFIDLYFYAARGNRRTYRLRAQFTWEPWNERFKIEPLDQRVDPVRRLASSKVRQRRREEWCRKQQAEQSFPRPIDPTEDPQRGERNDVSEAQACSIPAPEAAAEQDTEAAAKAPGSNGETRPEQQPAERLRFPSRF